MRYLQLKTLVAMLRGLQLSKPVTLVPCILSPYKLAMTGEGQLMPLPPSPSKSAIVTISLVLGSITYGSTALAAAPLPTISPEISQSTTIPQAKFDPIVVTATRSDRVVSDAPVPVQVLDQSYLKKHHAHTLKQAIALLPNVYLRQIHGKTGYEVLMQGLSGDQVLVLIDGLPVTASTGSTVNLNQYLNVDIAQIEVIQGASSAQYGSSAMGGVINVITKPITDSSAHITAEVASNGQQNPSDEPLDANRQYIEASLEGAVDAGGHLRARLSGSYLDDSGLTLDSDAWPRLKDASEQSQISARLSYTAEPSIDNNLQAAPSSGQLFNDTQLWAEASLYTEEDSRRYNYYAAPRYLPQQKDEQITKQRYSAGGRTNITPTGHNNALYQLSASALFEDYQSESDTTSNGIITSARDADITTALAQAQLDLPMWTPSSNIFKDHAHLLQIGAQYQQDTLSQTKNEVSELIKDEVSRDVGEVYLQDDWFIGEAWEVLAGVRYQDDTDFGGHAAPKVSVKYNHVDEQGHDHILRASVGNGYRVPNLKERYYIFDHSNLGYKVLGNPDLQPETSTSYQVGYAGQLADDLNLTINGFYNEIDDLIQTDAAGVTYEGNIAVYHYMNVDSAQTYGADIGIDWRVTPEAVLKAAYTYTKTKNDATGEELTLRPEHKAQVSLGYQLSPKIQLVEQLNYEGKQLVRSADESYSPAWWTLDSKLNYQVDEHIDVYAGVNNLFDIQRKPSDSSDYRPIDNREWLLGASYHW